MMVKEVQYNTKHREELINYLKTIPGKHVTIQEICDYFATTEHKIGLTTIYRQMERLVSEGVVQKYIIDGTSSACFEFTGAEPSNHDACFHFKCTTCGKLIHLTCDEIEHLKNHFKQEHHFVLDFSRTVFYGTCEACISENNE